MEVVKNTRSDNCEHGRDSLWCVDCRYGRYGQSRSEERPFDLVDEMRMRNGYKLVKGFGMINENK